MRWMAVAVVALGVAFGTLSFAQEPAADDAVTRAQFDAWMTELSNWGRWGDDDQLGALNLITGAKRVAAARLVETGRVVSMARDMTVENSADAVAAGADRPPVLRGSVRNVFGIDTENGYFWERYEIEYHGSLVTHIDALCHVAWNGRVYNGREFEAAASAGDGCTQMGSINLKGGLVTRGVLVDMPGTAVPAAGHRGVGGGDRHHHLARRRALPAHRPRRRPARRLPPVADPVPEGARHRVAGRRRAAGGGHGRGGVDPDPLLYPRRPGRAPVRQSRSGRVGGDGPRARPLGVSVHGLAARGAERRRFGGEPAGCVLRVLIRALNPGGRRGKLVRRVQVS